MIFIAHQLPGNLQLDGVIRMGETLSAAEAASAGQE
jgi:hypothetical protein